MQFKTKVEEFLKGQDVLGPNISVNHKQNTSFGTILGGICRLIVSFILWLFVIVQLYAWWFIPHYSQAVDFNYLSKKSNVVYEIPTSFMLPAVSLFYIDS